MKKLTDNQINEISSGHNVNAVHVKQFFRRVYDLPSYEYWNRSYYISQAEQNRKIFRHNRETQSAITRGIDMQFAGLSYFL